MYRIPYMLIYSIFIKSMKIHIHGGQASLELMILLP